jgi:hypothetical protein
MDFAKAFDKVPHKRLLYKLKYYGADTNTLNWIEDFHTLRTQTVILNGEKSEKNTCNFWRSVFIPFKI